MTRAMPLIPTTVCGSHGLPSWIHLVREAAQADRLGPIDLQEAYEDAVRLAIRDQVEAGRGLVVLEAMKMENEIRAPRAGTVSEVSCVEGDTVESGQTLVTLAGISS